MRIVKQGAGAASGATHNRPVSHSNDDAARPRVVRGGAARNGSVQSVERTLALLETLARAPRALGLRELGEAVGLPVGTTHRLVSVLVAHGYVQQVAATRRYTLGSAALSLAASMRARQSLPALARPYLRTLVELSGESANLAALEGESVVYLAQEQSARVMRMFTEVGNRAPIHATGTGKVMLAHLPDLDREALLAKLALVRYTPSTITDPRSLRAELARIREVGYARDDGELEEGVRCVAVPACDDSGVAAALSVSGPSSRLTADRVTDLLPRLLDLAARFSRVLGGGPSQA